MPKFVLVTGGVVSSLGKGITAASLGRLLKSRGVSVSMIKFDPYINVDPSTMSPYQHGEVYVLDDGSECDLDLGHYERFLDQNLTGLSNVSTGQIYGTVIDKERKGEFNGGTVQVIPHITNEIKDRLHLLAAESGADVIIGEIGGTVGDIESLPFLEAIRQLKSDVGRHDVLYIHVTLVPYIDAAGELKTKPTQHSVKELRSIGIQPDIIVCRTQRPLSDGVRAKIALFCDTEQRAVIQNTDVDCLYQVPLAMAAEGLDDIVVERLQLQCQARELESWRQLVERATNPSRQVTVALVGKYVALHDAYLSVVEALNHAGMANNAGVNIRWLNAEDLEKDHPDRLLAGADGIIVPGGLGNRGTAGKMVAARYAREQKVPFLGLSLGMHLAVIEFARQVLGLKGAHSNAQDPATPHPIVHHIQAAATDADDMRRGQHCCHLIPGTKAYAAYNQSLIQERYRQPYQLNNRYRQQLEAAGLIVSGLAADGCGIEIIELKDHPWFIGTQFQPELKSRPNRPHPLFRHFIAATLNPALM